MCEDLDDTVEDLELEVMLQLEEILEELGGENASIPE